MLAKAKESGIAVIQLGEKIMEHAASHSNHGSLTYNIFSFAQSTIIALNVAVLMTFWNTILRNMALIYPGELRKSSGFALNRGLKCVKKYALFAKGITMIPTI